MDSKTTTKKAEGAACADDSECESGMSLSLSMCRVNECRIDAQVSVMTILPMTATTKSASWDQVFPWGWRAMWIVSATYVLLSCLYGSGFDSGSASGPFQLMRIGFSAVLTVKSQLTIYRTSSVSPKT